MLVGVLVLSLACGLSAGIAAVVAGASWWVAAIAVVATGNLSVMALAFLRLATRPQGYAVEAWSAHDEPFEAVLPGPTRSTG